MVIILQDFCPKIFGRQWRMVLQRTSTRIICQRAKIQRWIYGTLRATCRQTQREKQSERNVKTPSNALDKVFSPGTLPLIFRRFSNAFTAGSRFMHHEKARLSPVKEGLSPMQENEGLTSPSRDKISKLHIGVFSI